ncbi:hypothetical protein Sam46_gp32 [Bacillus phage vB_BcM_Sam46]|uniref:Uncharacterized protein n=2 Tax=Caudoviricetes TaxID=2731619 RepID=A0A6G9L6P8_9CAUD|nr:hypothetical protein Sam112_gp32 [Bacillus phage vB_BcM_Sam112]QIQ61233.1 hypothetical protein Sam46_gp32 [Bacillus phage vB_BcM_Sam46]
MKIKFKKKAFCDQQYFLIVDGEQVGEVFKMEGVRLWQADDYRQCTYYGPTRSFAAEELIRGLNK